MTSDDREEYLARFTGNKQDIENTKRRTWQTAYYAFVIYGGIITLTTTDIHVLDEPWFRHLVTAIMTFTLLAFLAAQLSLYDGLKRFRRRVKVIRDELLDPRISEFIDARTGVPRRSPNSDRGDMTAMILQHLVLLGTYIIAAVVVMKG